MNMNKRKVLAKGLLADLQRDNTGGIISVIRKCLILLMKDYVSKLESKA
jgi:hypothetical protein